MIKSPKLRIKKTWESGEEICDLEQAKNLPFHDVFVFIEGQMIHSYDEIRLAAEKCSQGKEFLEVTMMMPVSGG